MKAAPQIAPPVLPPPCEKQAAYAAHRQAYYAELEIFKQLQAEGVAPAIPRRRRR